MTLAASYWTPKAILEALGAVIASECARPVVPGEPGGGCSFPVDVAYGDEEIAVWDQDGRGRVVLTPGAGELAPPGEMARDSVVMRWLPRGRAHIWAPANRVSGLDRTDALWRLAHCVLAAIHARHQGWPAAGGNPAALLDLEPDPEVFRYGQGAVIEFQYSVPVFEGRPIAPLGNTASIGNMSPGGGAGDGLSVNPAP